jgi:hypothetical protein
VRSARLAWRMGAGRLAIVRQLVVEACCSLWGRRPSIALARWSLDALLAVAQAGLLRVSQLSVNQRVWLYAFGLSGDNQSSG